MDNMKREVTCRTCLIEINKGESVSVHAVSDLIMLCSSVQISESDGLPSHICSECHEAARRAYDFRMLCEKSDMELRRRLECAAPHELIIKQEVIDANVVSDDFTVEKKVKFESLKCGSCDRTFLYKRNLKRHESEAHAVHRKGIAYDCCKCNKSFPSSKCLRAHQRRSHNQMGGHLCPTCGKQFTLPENLLRHQKIHRGEKQFRCVHCGKSFVQSGELKSHMVTHTSEKAYLCNVCGNKFARKQSLKKHVRRMHSGLMKCHTCELCGRSFKDKQDLRQHKRIHAEERKHVCKACGKAFNRRSNLTVHEYTHSDHRPHVCPICQKGFIQKHTLTTHVQKMHCK